MVKECDWAEAVRVESWMRMMREWCKWRNQEMFIYTFSVVSLGHDERVAVTSNCQFEMLRFGGFADRSLTNDSSAEFRASLVLPPTRFDRQEMGS